MKKDISRKKPSKKISPTVFSIFAPVLITLIIFSFSRLLYADVMPLPILFIVGLVMAALGAAFVYYVGGRWVADLRTVKEIILNRKINDVKKDALEWFEQNGFKISRVNKNFITATVWTTGKMKWLGRRAGGSFTEPANRCNRQANICVTSFSGSYLDQGKWNMAIIGTTGVGTAIVENSILYLKSRSTGEAFSHYVSSKDTFNYGALEFRARVPEWENQYVLNFANWIHGR